jgi:hypothetical protein
MAKLEEFAWLALHGLMVLCIAGGVGVFFMVLGMGE